jgi:hypothetical protein
MILKSGIPLLINWRGYTVEYNPGLTLLWTNTMYFLRVPHAKFHKARF